MIPTLLLAACAADGDRGRDGPGRFGDEDRPHGPPPRALFISPMGEPFRAAADAPYPVAAWFAQADRNHDGLIDQAEFAADAARFFEVLDADHDGVIDGFEVSRYEREIAPELSGGPLAGGRGQGGRGDPHARRGAALYGLLNDAEPISSADRQLNQRINRSDFAIAAVSRYRLLADDPAGLRLQTLPKTPAQLQTERALSPDDGKRGHKRRPQE